jgi:hypothetical protein
VLSAILLLAIRLAPHAPDVQFKQPQIAADGNFVAVSYGHANTVYFSSSNDGGKTFSPPVKVSSGLKLALGGHRGPRVVVAGNNLVISAIKGEKGSGADGDLIAWRSTDRGRTWSDGVRLNDTPAAAREGLHGMSANRNGVILATWLDLRSKATRLYGVVSKDGGATWSANRLIYTSPDGHICECCHPSAAVAPDGTLYTMWRNWLAGSRDLYVGVSNDGGTTFLTSKLGHGTWPLNACPMDGGGLALDQKGVPLTVWRRAAAVYMAAPGQQEVELGKGKNPSIALTADGQVYAAWSQGPAIVAKLPGRKELVTLASEGSYVHLAGSGPVYAAWESAGTIVIEKLTK